MPNQQGEREGSTQTPAPNRIIEQLGGELARTGQVLADKIGDAVEQAHVHKAEAARDQLHSAFLSQRDQPATRIQRFADGTGVRPMPDTADARWEEDHG